ncbi:MAG: DUF4343 domain-containing protein [Planctomycetota bacterium]|nr:MAG: DUF4343 domain-containing protein [Planctomycetota bacterium]REJ92437.1 MAG: DUF4343 domain-containing protein [Planctomycetota bacterium]REK23187.1 MAG: DUF4343 domain-containing protein [Planctomycetota bacterium]REK30895.1 MAG: DUF4343 domain-containing protein [Planctomycetota bacterium]
MSTLILTSRACADTQRLWRAAIARDWEIDRHRGPTLPETIGPPPYVLYTEEVYAAAVASLLGVQLVEPSLDWLANLPGEYAQRWIRFTTMGKARDARHPQFVKPPNDKSFEARVYDSGLALPSHIPEQAQVLVADPVEWVIEFRCFVLDRRVITLSPYLREGILLESVGFVADEAEICAARKFAEQLLNDAAVDVPSAVVLDVGYIKNRGWGAIELNSATSSGIYGCDADSILDVLAHATRPIQQKPTTEN